MIRGETMSERQLEWSETELLADHDIEASLVAGGRRCHGGFDANGDYVSPRTRHRTAAIDAWQRRHQTTFDTELLDIPLATWPESYPNVAQAKFLLAEGVRDPIVTLLTRIGTVEGFGAMIRYAVLDDPQQFFDESIAATAMSHLHHGLFEAHARDEAGWGEQAGHKEMWYAARDVAFEEPVSDDQTAEMLKRLGLSSGGSEPDPEKIREQMLATRMFTDIDLELETLIQRMINILLIEISAFHIFS